MTNTINSQQKLEVIETEAKGLVVRSGRCQGITTVSRETISASAVILTTGTFLNGLIHIGDKTIPAGRIDEKPSIACRRIWRNSDGYRRLKNRNTTSA
jgi:tRNA uridine 5-carboxymethylaminomethyl modification enzyme